LQEDLNKLSGAVGLESSYAGRWVAAEFVLSWLLYFEPLEQAAVPRLLGVDKRRGA
jgi:hypothetical protein